MFQIGTEEFNLLKNICISLKMAKPPDNIDASKFMTGIEKKVAMNMFSIVFPFLPFSAMTDSRLCLAMPAGTSLNASY